MAITWYLTARASRTAKKFSAAVAVHPCSNTTVGAFGGPGSSYTYVLPRPGSTTNRPSGAQSTRSVRARFAFASAATGSDDRSTTKLRVLAIVTVYDFGGPRRSVSYCGLLANAAQAITTARCVGAATRLPRRSRDAGSTWVAPIPVGPSSGSSDSIRSCASSQRLAAHSARTNVNDDHKSAP